MLRESGNLDVLEFLAEGWGGKGKLELTCEEGGHFEWISTDVMDYVFCLWIANHARYG